jgi:hypothetical protein
MRESSRKGPRRRIVKRPPPHEQKEEKDCRDLYEQVGCIVIKFSQAQKAQQTRGIADLLILCPKKDTFWWHEVKRRQGPEYQKIQHQQTPHQIQFQNWVELVGHTYILGPLSVAQQHLEKLGIIR